MRKDIYRKDTPTQPSTSIHPIKKNEEFLGKNACYLCDDTWDRTPADRLWVPSAIEIKNRCNAAAEVLD
ncbi:hypothetical protein [Porphyromonas bennonis]|uniref:hypothetical protein n=1 Tax=Porphyromonas bennonis TaxID=501496 RepID=UPI001FE156B4|nr:hypothetical protein [Porphyromonas bennonis]